MADARSLSCAPSRTPSGPNPLTALRPHIRYFWEGYRFTPGRIADDGEYAWVTDAFLPLLARLDPRDGGVAGPYLLKGSEGSTETFALAHWDGRLWVGTQSTVGAYEPASGRYSEWSAPGARLAAGPEGVWAVGGGRIVRVGAAGVELVVESTAPIQDVAVGGGACWTIAFSAEAARREARVSRLDPASGTATASTVLPGSPQQLVTEGDRVWANVWTGVGHRSRIRSVLVGLDPETGAAMSEIEIEPTGAFGPVVDGELWIDTADPFDPVQLRAPTRLSRLDPATSEPRGPIELDRSLDWVVGGRGRVWGRSGRDVVEITAEAGARRTFGLGDLEVAPHIPPPPAPIEADATEEKVRDDLAGLDMHGLTIHDVRLEGAFPATQVVVLYRPDTAPGEVFAHRERIWEDDGALADVDLIPVRLMEQV